MCFCVYQEIYRWYTPYLFNLLQQTYSISKFKKKNLTENNKTKQYDSGEEHR